MNEVSTETNGNLMYVLFDKGDGNFLMQNYRLHDDGNFKWFGEKSFTNKLDAIEAGRTFIR